SSAGRFAPEGKLACQWLDHIEDSSDVMFVVRQDDTCGKRVGDQKGVLGGQCLEDDRSARGNLFVLVVGYLDPGRFLIAAFGGSDDTAVQLAQDLIFFEC